MTIRVILEVLQLGDMHGSALKELAIYYDCEDYDISPITDAMAAAWVERRKKND